MSRLGLAFSCFFRVLSGKKLPPEVGDLLPPELRPQLPAPAPAPAPVAAAPRSAELERSKKVDPASFQRDGALALLALLQREGRLIDFTREAIDGFADAEIGAAARAVHRGCQKVLDGHFKLEPVMPGEEEAKVKVPKGFDPGEIRIIGEAKGEPPFTGTLRHHGWRAAETTMPTLADGVDRSVVAPAEVDVSR